MKMRTVAFLAASLVTSVAVAASHTVALIVQNHCSGGVEPPLAQLANWLESALTSPDLSIEIPANSIGKYQNVKPYGEEMPEASAKALAESLGKEGVLIASIQRFAAQTLADPSITTHRISVSMTLTLYNLGTGGSVCSASLSDESKTFDDSDMKANSALLYETMLQEAADKIAKKFLEKYVPEKWNPTPAKKIKVFFGCNVLGADVKIDGQSCGTCPMEFEVTAGLHNLKVSYPPYYFDFDGLAKFETNGQTFKVVLPITPEGESQRNQMLAYERKLLELKNSARVGDLEYQKKKKALESEQKERSELFKMQIELAYAMLDRYRMAGEADDYLRRTIAEGVSVYWTSGSGRVVVTDGTTDNVNFASPAVNVDNLVTPSDPGAIAKDVRDLLMGVSKRK